MNKYDFYSKDTGDKFALYTKSDNARYTLPGECILANDVVLPWNNGSFESKLYIIGNEYGPLGAVWANSDQAALDTLIDAGLGDRFLIEDEDMDDYAVESDTCYVCNKHKDAPDETADYTTVTHTHEYVDYPDITYLGNGDEPCDLQHAWLKEVKLQEQRDCRLIAAFVYAVEVENDTL